MLRLKNLYKDTFFVYKIYADNRKAGYSEQIFKCMASIKFILN